MPSNPKEEITTQWWDWKVYDLKIARESENYMNWKCSSHNKEKELLNRHED